ncbi:MAG: hypothetical protein ACHP6H_05830 [Legionellales bacterium]
MSGFVEIFPGSSPTGTSNTGSDILEANLGPVGPWSTKGILNAIPSGVILASRNAANSADVSMLALDGANDLTIGATGYASIVVAQTPLTVQGTATFQNPVTEQATATFNSAVIIQNQIYGALRVTSNFVSPPSGTFAVATAPSPYLIPCQNGNVAFDGTMFLQASGTQGVDVVVAAPSGAQMLAGFQGTLKGVTGTADTFNITSASLQATAVSSSVYAAVNQTVAAVSFAGSLMAATGVTGYAVITIHPIANGQTGTILAGSNIFLYPST